MPGATFHAALLAKCISHHDGLAVLDSSAYGGCVSGVDSFGAIIRNIWFICGCVFYKRTRQPHQKRTALEVETDFCQTLWTRCFVFLSVTLFNESEFILVSVFSRGLALSPPCCFKACMGAGFLCSRLPEDVLSVYVFDAPNCIPFTSASGRRQRNVR